MKKIYFLLLFSIFKFVSFGNVGITVPSLNISTCTFPSSYFTLGNIVINEGANGDFGLATISTNYMLVLTAPTNFEFLDGIGSVTGGSDITTIGITVTASTITITYQSSEANRTNEDDIITISGIQIRASNAASSGSILRTAGNPGSGVIAGITNGTTSFGNLTSVVSCSCNHILRVRDTFGDGWNGGTVSVSVNGTVVLNNVMLAGSSGPEDISFSAASSDVIRVYQTNAGSYPGEMMVTILDGGSTTIVAEHSPIAGTATTGGTTGNGNCPPPMSLTSSLVSQSSTASVSNCASNVQIVRLEITTTGVTTPLTLTQVQTRFTGTAAIAGITTERIYFTGNSSTFSTTTLFGTGVASTTTHNINGSQNLVSGVNYLWLVYDVNSSAIVGTTLDGEITQFTATAVNYNSGSTPSLSVTNPAGSRTLTLCLAPGGVGTGLETWIRADIGVTGSTPATAWSNQNSSGTPVLLNGSPNLNATSTSYNYNPFIDFTAPVGTLPNGAAANRQFIKLSGYNDISSVNFTSLFFAFQLNDLTRVNTHVACVEGITYSAGPANGSLHGHVNGTNAAIHDSGYDTDFGAGSPAGTWQRNGVNIAHDAAHTSTKQILSANCTSGNNTGLNRFLGGQVDDGGGFVGHLRDWKGPVAEIIGYSAAITSTQRQKIDSYMAVKYGITLPNNYLSTSGVTIYTTSAPYNLNIIGIGRDDVEALTQKQSHQDDDSVRIYMASVATSNGANTGSFTSDISYVIQGSDNRKLSSTASAMSEIPTGLTSCAITSRLEREWKVTRTNMSQNYNMDVKLSSIAAPGSVNVAHLRLLVDDDGNFGNGGTQCYYNGDGTGIVFTYSNPTITISNISTAHIPNNVTKFITIASINPATPLPIEIVYFDAKLNQKETVDLTWQTQSERDNDYFTIEKSTDGINWDFLGTVDGSGTTNIPQTYYLEDKNPSIGINYYKLSQTDFDGTRSEAGIRSVELFSTEMFVLSPNPAKNLVAILGKDLNEYTIQLYNNLGENIQVSSNLQNALKMELNTQNLSAGIYYVSLKSNTTNKVLKLIIEN